MAEQTTIETVEIPGAGRGVRLASGEILNPALASVKSLTRCGDEDYRRVLAWLEAERSAKTQNGRPNARKSNPWPLRRFAATPKHEPSRLNGCSERSRGSSHDDRLRAWATWL
jgi:hypothetical protein